MDNNGCLRVAAALGILSGLAHAAEPLSALSLQGTYSFRYLGVNANASFTPLSFQGTLTFDGHGGFQIAGQGYSNADANHTLPVLPSGTYSVLSSGLLRMTNPFDGSGFSVLYGGVGTDAVVASSTESPFCDLLVAIPAARSGSNAQLSGTYYVASMDILNGDFGLIRDTFFPLTADGKGGFGNITIKGRALNLGSTPASQVSAAASYTVNPDGSATAKFPPPAGVAARDQLLSGTKLLYVSADGSFFIGGGQAAYDLIVGVKAFSGSTPNEAFQGLYFLGGLQGYVRGAIRDGVYGWWGSANEISASKTEVAHVHLHPAVYAPYDYLPSGDFTLAADGTATSADSQFALALGGTFGIGAGNGANYQVYVYVKAPTVTGTGVFVNPQGVLNAASNTPFTAQISPGEVITLCGSGLADETEAADSPPFAAILGGTQVTIDGTTATMLSVSPSQVSVVVPFSIPAGRSLLNVTLMNGSAMSNTVQVFSGQTSPGIFAMSTGELGNGTILHSDYTPVTPDNPARRGEIVQIYMTGLGAVRPAVADGEAGPVSPPSLVTDLVSVFIGGLPAAHVYAGLAPTLVGIYQVNVIVPVRASLGSLPIEISTVDADSIQATIPVGN